MEKNLAGREQIWSFLRCVKIMKDTTILLYTTNIYSWRFPTIFINFLSITPMWGDGSKLSHIFFTNGLIETTKYGNYQQSYLITVNPFLKTFNKFLGILNWNWQYDRMTNRTIVSTTWTSWNFHHILTILSLCDLFFWGWWKMWKRDPNSKANGMLVTSKNRRWSLVTLIESPGSVFFLQGGSYFLARTAGMKYDVFSGLLASCGHVKI